MGGGKGQKWEKVKGHDWEIARAANRREERNIHIQKVR